MAKKVQRPKPRIPRGFRDVLANDVTARRKMISIIRHVYELHGFEPLETPAMEYVETLGKYLPESDTPAGGIFAMRDDEDQWISLRYDLTAPLSRFVAQMGNDLQKPFRRYQIGPVWRLEKPGPGRFREFYQCDFDTVGAPSLAADAEACIVFTTCFEKLGFKKGEYLVRVNNRKILNGVLDMAKIEGEDTEAGSKKRLTVLRSIDKLDKLGTEAVKELLGKGRLDESGDFTEGAGLTDEQTTAIMAFIETSGESRESVLNTLRDLVGTSEIGLEGVSELETIHQILETTGIGSDQVIFDPSIVRGLAYYTGPVYEAELTFEIKDRKGKTRSIGSVGGGGRYDSLVERFTGTTMPATGASIGIDRLLTALKMSKWLEEQESAGPILVVVFEKDQLTEYQNMVNELRAAELPSELYLGSTGGGYGKRLKRQLTYGDKRNSPVAVIAGGNEFEQQEVQVKDMILGRKQAEGITERDEWLKKLPGQETIKRSDLVSKCREILARHQKSETE